MQETYYLRYKMKPVTKNLIDLKDHCVLCYKKSQDNDRTENQDESQSLSKTFIKVITTKLEIPIPCCKLQSPSSGEIVPVCEEWFNLITGAVCESCRPLMGTFCGLHRQLEAVKSSLSVVMNQIVEVISETDSNESVLLNSILNTHPQSEWLIKILEMLRNAISSAVTKFNVDRGPSRKPFIKIPRISTPEAVLIKENSPTNMLDRDAAVMADSGKENDGKAVPVAVNSSSVSSSSKPHTAFRKVFRCKATNCDMSFFDKEKLKNHVEENHEEKDKSGDAITSANKQISVEKNNSSIPLGSTPSRETLVNPTSLAGTLKISGHTNLIMKNGANSKTLDSNNPENCIEPRSDGETPAGVETQTTNNREPETISSSLDRSINKDAESGKEKPAVQDQQPPRKKNAIRISRITYKCGICEAKFMKIETGQEHIEKFHSENRPNESEKEISKAPVTSPSSSSVPLNNTSLMNQENNSSINNSDGCHQMQQEAPKTSTSNETQQETINANTVRNCDDDEEEEEEEPILFEGKIIGYKRKQRRAPKLLIDKVDNNDQENNSVLDSILIPEPPLSQASSLGKNGKVKKSGKHRARVTCPFLNCRKKLYEDDEGEQTYHFLCHRNEFICCTCLQKCKTPIALAEHVINAHGRLSTTLNESDNIRICPLCPDNEVKVQLNDYPGHFISNHMGISGLTMYKCPRKPCNFLSATKNGIRSHVRKFHKLDIETSQLPGQSSQNVGEENTGDMNMNNVLSDKSGLNCHTCNEDGFLTLANLQDHQREKHESDILQCKYCPKKFTLNVALERHHSLSHINRIVIKRCNMCPGRKFFTSSMAYNSHVKLKHPGVGASPIKATELLIKAPEQTKTGNISVQACKEVKQTDNILNEKGNSLKSPRSMSNAHDFQPDSENLNMEMDMLDRVKRRKRKCQRESLEESSVERDLRRFGLWKSKKRGTAKAKQGKAKQDKRKMDFRKGIENTPPTSEADLQIPTKKRKTENSTNENQIEGNKAQNQYSKQSNRQILQNDVNSAPTTSKSVPNKRQHLSECLNPAQNANSGGNEILKEENPMNISIKRDCENSNESEAEGECVDSEGGNDNFLSPKKKNKSSEGEASRGNKTPTPPECIDLADDDFPHFNATPPVYNESFRFWSDYRAQERMRSSSPEIITLD